VEKKGCSRIPKGAVTRYKKLPREEKTMPFRKRGKIYGEDLGRGRESKTDKERSARKPRGRNGCMAHKKLDPS